MIKNKLSELILERSLIDRGWAFYSFFFVAVVAVFFLNFPKFRLQNSVFILLKESE